MASHCDGNDSIVCPGDEEGRRQTERGEALEHPRHADARAVLAALQSAWHLFDTYAAAERAETLDAMRASPSS